MWIFTSLLWHWAGRNQTTYAMLGRWLLMRFTSNHQNLTNMRRGLRAAIRLMSCSLGKWDLSHWIHMSLKSGQRTKMEKENGEVGQHTLVVRYYCPYTCRPSPPPPPPPEKKSLKLGLVWGEGMHCPRVRIPLAVCDSHVTVNLFINSFTLAPQSQNPSNDPTPNGSDIGGMKLYMNCIHNAGCSPSQECCVS